MNKDKVFLLRCPHHKVTGCDQNGKIKWCTGCELGNKHCHLKATIFKHKRAMCSHV